MDRSAIDTLYARLLEHHKLLLEAMRAQHEQEHGRVANAAAFLDLLIKGEAFAWLQPFTTVLVEIDDPKLTPDLRAARVKVERLFSAESPSFDARHREILAHLPEAARSHAQTLELLASLERRE